MTARGAKKSMVTKGIKEIEGQEANTTSRIQELLTKIQQAAPEAFDGKTVLIDNSVLPITEEGVEDLFELASTWRSGRDTLAACRDRVVKAVDALKTDCYENGDEPQAYPEDVQALVDGASEALSTASSWVGTWSRHLTLLKAAMLNPAPRGTIREGGQSRGSLESETHGTTRAVKQLQDSSSLDPLGTIRESQASLCQGHGTIRDTRNHITVPDPTLATIMTMLNEQMVILKEQQKVTDTHGKLWDHFLSSNSFVESERSMSPVGTVMENFDMIHFPEQNRDPETTPAPPVRHSSPKLPTNEAWQMPNTTPRQPNTERSDRRSLNLLNELPAQEPPQQQQEQNPYTRHSLPQSYNNCILPPLRAQPFDGRRTEYEKFKAIFNITIGANSLILKVQKLLYLTDLLPKQDKATVNRYPLSDEGYRLAWQYLESKYGNTNDMAEDLLSQLKGLTVDNNTVQANKHMWLEAQSIVAQLETIETLEPRSVIEMTLNKFTPELRRSIYKGFTDDTTKSWWKFSNITDQTLNEYETLERRDKLYGFQSSKEGKHIPVTVRSETKNDRMNSGTFIQKKCIYCNAYDDHYSSECTVVPMTRRKDFLKNHGRCENCTSRSHTTDMCNGKMMTCKKCNSKHHRSLPCLLSAAKQNWISAKANSTSNQKANPQRGANNQSVQTTTMKLNIIHGDSQPECNHKKEVQSVPPVPTLHYNLPILYGKIEGKEEHVPILLDCGAQISLLESSLAQELNLNVEGTTKLNMQGFLSEGFVTLTSNIVRLTLEGPANFNLSVQLHTMDNLIGDIGMTSLSRQDRIFLKKRHIRVPRHGSEHSVRPAIILGIDILWKILDGLKTKELPSENVLIVTKLGSLLTGPNALNSISKSEQGKNRVVRQCHMLVNGNLGESIGFSNGDLPLAVSDEPFMVTEQMKSDYVEKEEINQKVLQEFNRTIDRRENGYYVKLPVKDNIEHLKDNFWMALTRLRQFTNNIRKKQPEVFHEYIEAIELLKDRNFIEEVIEDDCREQEGQKQSVTTKFYLPHQGVKAPGKSLRIVFDASSHIRNEASLNDMVHTGPLLLRPLIGILWSTRFNRYMITGDLEKAFLHVHLEEQSRDLVRFLWMRDPREGFTENNLVTYRFTRVPFGLCCSPFLLNATVLFHLSNHPSELAKKILRSLYVDNVVMTVNSKEEVISLCSNIKEIFNELHMNMRSFLVNDKTEYEKFPESDRGKWEIQKVLGVLYDPETDEYIHSLVLTEPPVLSKRSIAHAIGVTFDPLGLLSPLILRLKLSQQEIAKSQYDWDTCLETKHADDWYRTLAEVNGFEKRIPRMIAVSDTPIQITVCSDASKKAIAATIHINQGTSCHIAMAKSRIINRDKIALSDPTIPKLELASLALASTLAKEYTTEIKEHGVRVNRITFLSDSTVALQWLRQGQTVKHSQYTQNRILEFTKNVNSICEVLHRAPGDSQYGIWLGHIPSDMNPADSATRGLTSAEFTDHMWWKGHTFFGKPFDQWLIEPPTKWESIHICAVQIAQEPSPLIHLWTCSNDLLKLYRITAYMLRFIDRLKMAVSKNQVDYGRPQLPNPPDQVLTAFEMERAATVLAHCHQQAKDNMEEVRMKNPKLNAFNDKYGIWRCKGRLENCPDLSYDQRHPILITPHSRMAELIILESHGKYHNGVNLTMAKVRERFWIPKLRSQVNHITRRCFSCQKMSRTPQTYPDMGALPERRIAKSFPFAHIGLDHFGPITTVEKGEREKTYGLILTCLTTRLIHLEIVPSMSCSSFLMAMRRFMARRGTPRSVTCDNSPTFHLAETIMEEWYRPWEDDDFKSFMANRTIEFNFITPLSPWKGGTYERLIGTVKSAFNRSVSAKSGLTREELETVFCEIEHLINCRPLTQPEEQWTPDLKERLAIRPIDFICPNFEYTLPAYSSNEEEYQPASVKQKEMTKTSTLQALQASLSASETLWNRWSSEYLTNLRDSHITRMRQRKRVQHDPLRLGQVVLLCDDIVPRIYWKLAVITEIRLSTDGQCRELQLKTGKNKFTRRPPNKIVPLEMDCDIVSDTVGNSHTDPQNLSTPTIPKYLTRKVKMDTDKGPTGSVKLLLIHCSFRTENPPTEESPTKEEMPDSIPPSISPDTANKDLLTKKLRKPEKKGKVTDEVKMVLESVTNMKDEMSNIIYESQAHLESLNP